MYKAHRIYKCLICVIGSIFIIIHKKFEIVCLHIPKIMENFTIEQRSSINDRIIQENDINLPCRWDLSIITNCQGSIYFFWIYYISITICFILLITSLVILIYKLPWNSNLISNLGPIKGFLIWMILHGSFRAVSMLIITNDWLHDNYIIKSIINIFGWSFGCIAAATYLVSIFKVLPHLALHTNTVFDIEVANNLIIDHFIPKDSTVLKIYWTFIIIMITTSLILSILKGYFQMVDKELLFNIIQTTILIEYCGAYILGALCFIKYGRLVVKLLDESAKIMGLEDIRKSENKASRLVNYRTYLNKLKIMNFSLSILVCWLGVLSFFLVLFRNKIGEYLTLYIILAFISFDGTAIIMLITLFGIIYGEIHKRHSAVAEELSTSINFSRNNE
ncbi:hypothetical protein F8M41_007020 [Gigaspora margarita]|uniref:Uncharacterized protein n=1 Tax=Gigaspora margarita TaxID=4874 RepID=A0A8H4B4J1_GIGMA|nr:hypothetical protein F8M41_007020 [Gigaspora margarita]